MYPINLTKNCQVYTSLLFNDLKQYKLTEDIANDTIALTYTTGIFAPGSAPAASSVDIKADKLLPIINSKTPTGGIPDDIWLPAFIQNDDLIDNQEILGARVIGNKVLGIEDMIKINQPKFKNWTFESGESNSSLTTDWIINSNLSSNEIEYGVLFWYKKNSSSNNSSTEYLLSQIPNLSSVISTQNLSYTEAGVSYQITENDYILKLNDTKLLKLDTKQTFDLAKVAEYTSKKFKLRSNTNYLHNTLKDYNLWISNGEFYSYYLNPKDKYDLQTHRTRKVPSRSYLSPCLYNIYRSIYNSLTSRDIKKITEDTFVSTNEKLKKLCYVLATGPILDKVCVNYLDHPDVASAVSAYISTPGENTTELELQALIDAVKQIMTLYKNLGTDSYSQTLANNFIYNKTDLITKLQSKYSTSLKIPKNTNTRIKFNKKLEQGAQGYFNLGVKSFCDKNAPSGPGSPGLYNNFIAEVGNIKIQTDIVGWGATGHRTNVLFINKDKPEYNNILPLADIIENKRKDRTTLNLGKDIKHEFTPNFNEESSIAFKMPQQKDDDVDYYNSTLNAPVKESFVWGVVDGPENCVRFSNFAKWGNKRKSWRNKTSNDEEPIIFIKSTGVYTLECTRTTDNVLKKTDRIKLYVVDSNNNTSLPLLEHNYDISIKKRQAICPNIRQFAVNRRGLVWFVDSDMRVTEAERLSASERPVFCINKKIPLSIMNHDDATVKLTDGDLYFEFNPHDTILKLSHISIEKMRDNLRNNCQCKSFFEDKLVRQRDNGNDSIIFSARYFRIDRYPDAATYVQYKYNKEFNNVEKDKLIDFDFPDISTIYAPRVMSYGGYSQEVINNIGIEIPYHPVIKNGENSTTSVKALPPNTVWGGSAISGGILAEKPAPMTDLLNRNDMGGIRPNYRCHLIDIPITGYTIFKKGYFHPNSGWFSYDVTPYNPQGNASYSSLDSVRGANITSVKRYKQRLYKSYYFKGYGFFDMHPNTSGDSNVPNLYQSAIKIQEQEPGDSTYNYEHHPHYGYRNVNGVSPKDYQSIDDIVVDDYLTNSDTPETFQGPLFAPTTTYTFISGVLDDLTVKDLELKLNFLNYPNPKNLAIALEVIPSGSINSPDSEKIFINHRTDQELDSLPSSITDYINKLKTMNNLTTNSSGIVLYLFNKESLNNYDYHFSLNFSDNANKYYTFGDENKFISASGLAYPTFFNESVLTNGTIQPTISATGLSDKDSLSYKHILKNNNISLKECSFAKFKDIPLKDTLFNLKIIVLGSEEYIKPADNIINNNEIAGLNTFDARATSNTLYNSLCSWDLVIHTTGTRKFNNKTPLGSMSYDNTSGSRISGYNYLADFTNKKYLIPKVNLIAPYDYIADSNICKYTNDSEASKPLRYPNPIFPNLSLPFTPFCTLVGAMNAIYEIQAAYGVGGWGDPLISYLWTQKYNKMAEDQEKKYFQPVYSFAGHGEPYKAIILASKDKIAWYKMEASIFKYQNTPILTENKFQYIKLNKNLCKPLSQFSYKKVMKIEDLIDKSYIKNTFNVPISRFGLTVTTNNNTTYLNKDDIVIVTGQTSESDNGIYIVKSDSWERFDFTKVNKLLTHNHFYKFPTNIIEQNIKNGKVIMLSGVRAAHYFDIDDYIELSEDKEFTSSSVVSQQIKDKATIYLNNTQYTLLYFDTSIDKTNGFIAKNEDRANVLLLYKDNATFLDKSTISKWGIIKTKEEIVPEIIVDNTHSVAVAEGSVGYGTSSLQPNTFSRIVDIDNKIYQTYDIFNNNKNDKFKFNNISIKQYDQNNTIKQISFDPSIDPKEKLLTGYPYSFQDFQYLFDASAYNIINPNKDENITESLDSLKRILQNNNLQTNISDYYFLELKSNKFIDEITCNSGEIVLENDFLLKQPIAKFSDEDKTTINNRLNFLNTPTAGLVLSSATLDSVNSIPDVTAYYNSLSVNATGCVSASSSDCSKANAKAKLVSLYAEKNDLLLALDIDKKTPSGVLPYKEAQLTINPTTNRVSVKYINKDYYWINIDSSQRCSLSQEALPRVLKEVEYNCDIIYAPLFPLSCTSMCKSAVKNTSENISGIDEDIGQSDRSSLVYKNKKADEQKAKFPQVTTWVDETVAGGFDLTKKTFFISCNDPDSDGIANKMKDIIVNTQEKYFYPQIANNMKEGLVRDIFNLNTQSEIYVKFKNVPRKLKTIDQYYNRYEYDYNGNIGESIFSSENGPMSNGFAAWACVGVKDSESFDINNQGKYIEPPDFYKMQNEMIFRAFFGSTDGVEHKNTNSMTSKEMWEWIPYEYYTSGVL